MAKRTIHFPIQNVVSIEQIQSCSNTNSRSNKIKDQCKSSELRSVALGKSTKVSDLNIENHLSNEIEYKNSRKIGYININSTINDTLMPKIADNSRANNNKLDNYETNEKSEDIHKIITKSVSKRIIKKLKPNYEKSNNLNDLPEVNYLSNNLPEEIISFPQSKKTINNDPFKLHKDLSIDKNHEFVNPIIPDDPFKIHKDLSVDKNHEFVNPIIPARGLFNNR